MEGKYYQIAKKVGDVLLLNSDGSKDASVAEMNRRCQNIINRECRNGGLPDPMIKDYDRDECFGGYIVRDYFITQLKLSN